MFSEHLIGSFYFCRQILNTLGHHFPKSATDIFFFGYLILAFKVLIGRCNLENKEAPRKTEDFNIHI